MSLIARVFRLPFGLLVIVAVWFPVPTLIVYCNICVVASVDLGNPLALRQRPGNRLDSREWHHVNLCAVLWCEALREPFWDRN